MTEREAITHLQNISEIIPGYCRSEAFDVAIGALQKQVPKEPVVSNENYDEIEYLCPVCNRLVGNMNYCLSCGQRLNWE